MTQIIPERGSVPQPKIKWNKFFAALEGPKGCNFRKRKPDGQVIWNCAGGMSHELASKVLKEMGYNAKTIQAVSDFCRSMGGHCDCEILLNVEERVKMAPEDRATEDAAINAGTSRRATVQ